MFGLRISCQHSSRSCVSPKDVGQSSTLPLWLRPDRVACMPPSFRRYLPFVLIAVFLLFLLPTLLHKKTTSGPSPSTRASQTIEAMNLIDRGEKAYRTANGHFTPHIADLLSTPLANDLAIGLVVQLDVGSDGQRYLAQVRSDLLSLVRGRNGPTVTAQSCLVLTSSSGVACPAPVK